MMDTGSENSTAPRQTAPAPRPSSTPGRLARLCLKELREILRDRRTIVTLVFMPLLVYPLLSMAFQKLLLTSMSNLQQIDCRVGVATETDAARLQYVLRLGESILADKKPRPNATPKSVPSGLENEPTITLMVGSNVLQDVASGLIDAAVVIKDSKEVDPRSGLNEQFRCELVYRTDSALGKAAIGYLERRLRAVNDNYITSSFGTLLPTDVTTRSIAGVRADFSLTTLVPLILILMTITGAVYPAIDLTAGERERGTLETLMTAPVPRLGLLLAKYVAVLTVALFTATANLVAMTITLVATGLGEGLTSTLVAQVFALLILFAAFFSAILLAVTSFARSFKEAQAYLIPLMLLSLAPGMMSLMPDLKFNGVLAVTPLVNIVLLARDLFEGNVQPSLAIAAVLSTALYAFAAIAVAARIFGTDAILYGSQATWSDLFTPPAQRRQTPTITAAVFCLAAIFPPYFLLGNLLHRMTDVSIAKRLVLASGATALLFALLPLTAAAFQRMRIRSAFQLRASGMLSFAGALLLGLSLWPFAHEVYLVNEALGWSSISSQRLEEVSTLLSQWRQLSPWLIVLTMAIIPGVCEEFFFRGYMMGALRRALKPWPSIVISALLFGAFHIIATSTLSAERFLPSTFMGLALGWVCYRTGSVLPGMLLHSCHNGLLLLVAYYRPELEARGWGLEERSHMPALWLACAAVGVGLGVVLILCSTRRTAEHAEKAGGVLV